MCLRNWCFERGLLNQQKVDLPVISVGNLAVGGTGKTPMVELIIEELRARGYNPAVVSRGYGRKTSGPIMVAPSSTAIEVGDEPLQIYHHMGCPVFVAEKRLEAVPLIEKWNAQHTVIPINVIVLDDAFQHRYIKRDFNILLTDYHRLYTRDRVLPWGRLRESRTGAKRADIIVVTKCPPCLSRDEAFAIRKELNPLAHQQVVFCTIAYRPLPEFKESPVLITGIANPQPILDHLRDSGIKISEHLRFPDHHIFSLDELKKIKAISVPIITTAKDAVRIPDNRNIHILQIRTKILYKYAANS